MTEAQHAHETDDGVSSQWIAAAKRRARPAAVPLARKV